MQWSILRPFSDGITVMHGVGGHPALENSRITRRMCYVGQTFCQMQHCLAFFCARLDAVKEQDES